MGGGTSTGSPGASMQAVTTAPTARRVHSSEHQAGLAEKRASNVTTVVRSVRSTAQAGMFNIFIVIFCLTAYAFFRPEVLISYLVSNRRRWTFQAV